MDELEEAAVTQTNETYSENAGTMDEPTEAETPGDAATPSDPPSKSTTKNKTKSLKKQPAKKITPAKAAASSSASKHSKKTKGKPKKGQMTLGRFFAKQSPAPPKISNRERFQRDCTLEQQATIRKICMGIFHKTTPQAEQHEKAEQHEQPNCVSPEEMNHATPSSNTDKPTDSPPSKPHPLQLAPGMEAAVQMPVNKPETDTDAVDITATQESETPAPESLSATTPPPKNDNDSSDVPMPDAKANDDTTEDTPMPDASQADQAKEESKSPTRSSPRKKTTPVPSSSSQKQEEQQPLPKERQSQMTRYQTMHDKYLPRAQQLLQICLELQDQPTLVVSNEKPAHGDNVTCPKGTFPEFAIQQLAMRIEGQSETLSVMAERVTKELNQAYDTECFHVDATKEQIRLSASRKPYLKNLSAVDSSITASVDDNEDTQPAYLWRWECEVKEIIPSHLLLQVTRSRGLRRKASIHFNAASKLVASLAEMRKLLASTNTKPVRIEKLTARIQQEEEKFRKMEDAEQKATAKRKRQEQDQQLKDRKKDEANKLKQKLAQEKKRQKEEKERAQKIKEQKRKTEMEEKAKQKELAAQEKDRKKQEVLQAKQRKEAEIQKVEQAQQARLEKQKNLMKSFFGKAKGKKTDSPKNSTGSVDDKTTTLQSTSSVLSQIGGQGTTDSVLPIKLSAKARQHRRPRATFVERTVYVSAEDDNDPWNQNPSYAQEKLVKIRELPKFLSFCEDVRPPYYGTWSKTSKDVTGRRPFGKDTSCFDYEYDSEAEWEEEDCDLGEDLGAVDNEESSINKDEGEVDEDDNGWLAEDDSDADEETKQMRKKMRLERTKTAMVMIAPCMGGKPFASQSNEPDQSCRLEGIDATDASKLLHEHGVIDANDFGDNFDVFPPMLMEEMGPEEEKAAPKNEMTPEMEKSFLESVHNSTLASKTLVVDEVLKKVPSMSKAGALKKLESVADKQKHPVRGFLWQVKKDALESVGLAHLADTEAAQESEKREYLCRMARQIHHSVATSREKLEQEMVATNGEELTRAECARLVNQLAEKTKDPASNTIYWVIKSEKQRELGLELPMGAPPKSVSSHTCANTANTSESFTEKSSSEMLSEAVLEVEEDPVPHRRPTTDS